MQKITKCEVYIFTAGSKHVLNTTYCLKQPEEWFLQNASQGMSLTRGCIFWDVKRVHRPGELGGVVIHILDGDVYPHVRRLKAIICSNQQWILGPVLSVQPLGGYEISRFGVNSEAVISSTNESICDQSICTLRKKTRHVNCWSQEHHFLKFSVIMNLTKEDLGASTACNSVQFQKVGKRNLTKEGRICALKILNHQWNKRSKIHLILYTG